jgi:hypothetical protein
MRPGPLASRAPLETFAGPRWRVREQTRQESFEGSLAMVCLRLVCFALLFRERPILPRAATVALGGR